MHDSARKFVKSITPLIRGSVLEIGSRNVNGSIRYLFSHATKYVGIDIREGPGVDIVIDGANWDGDGDTFDAVVCCEVLEHAGNPAELCNAMFRLAKPGGVIVITAATPERKPHSGIDGGELREGEQYQGIEPHNIKNWFVECQTVMIDSLMEGDIYAMVIR